MQNFNAFSISDHSFDVNNLLISSDKKHSLDLFMPTSFAYEEFTDLVIADFLTIGTRRVNDKIW